METSYKSKKEFIVNTIYILIFGVIAYFILKYGLGLLSPFILAFIISYLLQTPAKFLTKKFNIKDVYDVLNFLQLYIRQYMSGWEI